MGCIESTVKAPLPSRVSPLVATQKNQDSTPPTGAAEEEPFERSVEQREKRTPSTNRKKRSEDGSECGRDSDGDGDDDLDGFDDALEKEMTAVMKIAQRDSGIALSKKNSKEEELESPTKALHSLVHEWSIDDFEDVDVNRVRDFRREDDDDDDDHYRKPENDALGVLGPTDGSTFKGSSSPTATSPRSGGSTQSKDSGFGVGSTFVVGGGGVDGRGVVSDDDDEDDGLDYVNEYSTPSRRKMVDENFEEPAKEALESLLVVGTGCPTRATKHLHHQLQQQKILDSLVAEGLLLHQSDTVKEKGGVSFELIAQDIPLRPPPKLKSIKLEKRLKKRQKHKLNPVDIEERQKNAERNRRKQLDEIRAKARHSEEKKEQKTSALTVELKRREEELDRWRSDARSAVVPVSCF